MKSLFAKTDNSGFINFHKSCFLLLAVFLLLLLLFNQNKPTAVWLKLIGMQDKKQQHDFELSVFANELFKYNMVFSPLNNWPLNSHCIKANLKYNVENIILDARGSG